MIVFEARNFCCRDTEYYKYFIPDNEEIFLEWNVNTIYFDEDVIIKRVIQFPYEASNKIESRRTLQV
jgi:hypothetical protein